MVRHSALLSAMFSILREADGPIPPKEVIERVAQRLPLTAYEASRAPAGSPAVRHLPSLLQPCGPERSDGWPARAAAGR